MIDDEEVVPAGINVVDGGKIEEEELDQEICLLDDEKVAVNVNTLQELRIAETLISKAAKNSS